MTAATLPGQAAPLEGGWEGPFDLASLVARLGEAPERRARFREARHLAALDRPLESEGTLLWRRPDMLEKITFWPRPERVTVQGSRVVLELAGRAPETVDLAAQPELRALLEALRAPLAGDAAALERDFAATLSGTPATWSLQLVPRDRRARRAVESVVLTGSGAEPSVIRVREANGDEQVLRLTPLP